MNSVLTKPANQLSQILRGEYDFVQLPDEALLTDAERHNILATLDETPYTFEHPDMPSCWGKAFENYLSMEEYLAPHPLDGRIAQLCAPIHRRLVQLLENQGYEVAPLTDPVRNQPYTLGDFRRAIVPAQSKMLHVDDLSLDGKWKSDFVLPIELQGQDFRQLMVMLTLATGNDAGRLRSYERRYQPSDAAHLNENGWQFSEAVVAGAPFYDYRPKAGEAIVMANQYFHDILGESHDNYWTVYSTYIMVVPGQKKVWLYI